MGLYTRLPVFRPLNGSSPLSSCFVESLLSDSFRFFVVFLNNYKSISVLFGNVGNLFLSYDKFFLLNFLFCRTSLILILSFSLFRFSLQF